MTSKEITPGRCIKCDNKIGPKQNKLQCKQCSFLLYQKCTNISSRASYVSALDKIGNWMKANKLTLNVEKSNLILFNIKKNSKSISNSNIIIYIDNDEKEHKKAGKYLGV